MRPDAPQTQPWLRIVGLFLGLGLLLAAVVVAMQTLTFDQIDPDSLFWIGPAALAVMVNLVLTSVLFWHITRSFDATPAVSFMLMLRLICTSALLNYLPLRPGVMARAAVLKKHHQLPLRQSMLIWLCVTVVGASVMVMFGLIVLVIMRYLPTLQMWGTFIAAMAMVALLSGLCQVIGRRVLRRSLVQAWLWPWIKAVDLLFNALRLWMAFQLVGSPVRLSDAIIAAAAGWLAGLVPIVPNGLGVREWVIVLVTEPFAVGSTSTRMAAALVDRAIETLIVVISGLACLVGLRKKLQPPG